MGDDQYQDTAVFLIAIPVDQTYHKGKYQFSQTLVAIMQGAK